MHRLKAEAEGILTRSIHPTDQTPILDLLSDLFRQFDFCIDLSDVDSVRMG